MFNIKKNVCLSLIGLSMSVFGNTSATLTNCKDQTFAYNQLNTQELEDHLKIELSGSTIFQQSADENWGHPNAKFDILIAKEDCRFSEDKKLVRCLVDESIVVVSELRGPKKLSIKNLEFNISFFENAPGWINSVGFKLSTKYEIDEQVIRTNTIFYGDRLNGCIL